MHSQSRSRRNDLRTRPSRNWRQVVAQYRSSELSQREFCEKARVPLSTLNWWLVRARRDASTEALTFAERPFPPTTSTSAAPTSTWAVEMAFPGDRVLRFAESPSVAMLVQLLRDARC